MWNWTQKFSSVCEDSRDRAARVVGETRVAAQALVEYGLIVALMAVAALGAIQAFGGGISAFFTRLLGHFAPFG
jgi:Flp pilus assembly pilin Flp